MAILAFESGKCCALQCAYCTLAHKPFVIKTIAVHKIGSEVLHFKKHLVKAQPVGVEIAQLAFM